MIDGGRDDVAAGVAMGRQRSRHVDPMLQTATQQGAERVGIVRQNKLGHFGLRCTDGTGTERLRIVHGDFWVAQLEKAAS